MSSSMSSTGAAEALTGHRDPTPGHGLPAYGTAPADWRLAIVREREKGF